MKKIQILGSGCPSCQRLQERASQAVSELGLDYEVVKVSDINDIIDMGVMKTPALAVDGSVKLAGKIPEVEELKVLLSNQE